MASVSELGSPESPVPRIEKNASYTNEREKKGVKVNDDVRFSHPKRNEGPMVRARTSIELPKPKALQVIRDDLSISRKSSRIIEDPMVA